MDVYDENHTPEIRQNPNISNGRKFSVEIRYEDDILMTFAFGVKFVISLKPRQYWWALQGSNL